MGPVASHGYSETTPRKIAHKTRCISKYDAFVCVRMRARARVCVCVYVCVCRDIVKPISRPSEQPRVKEDNPASDSSICNLAKA